VGRGRTEALNEARDILIVENAEAGMFEGGRFVILDCSGPILTMPDGKRVDVGTKVRLAFKVEHILPVIHGLSCVAVNVEHPESQ
jgi:hypothetical protein